MTGIDRIRQEAASCFAQLGFPTTRDEEWRFTSVAPIARTRFSPASAVLTGWSDGQLEEALCPTAEGFRMVFVNGRYSRKLSTRKPLHGLSAAPLRGGNGNIEVHLARYADYRNRAFVALNTANFEDGASIEIPARTIVAEPIHLVFLATGGDTPVASHPRTLIIVGADSHATVVESYLGRGPQYFTNAVTEIVAGNHSVVDHYKLQDEDERSFHVTTLHVELGPDASFSTHSISIGGGLVRNDVNTVLEQGTEATVNGFYLASGSQHIDNHTAIDHAQPHGTSHELYKGILGGRAAAVFNGRIVVRPGAQKTDAKQTNKNLLLSEDATINTKPELQIWADDVRCTHGATIGQLDPDAIFYLQSRGIGQEEARNLLTHAFARDIIDRIRVEPLRAHIERKLRERLHASRN